MGKMVLTVLGMVAEMELGFIKERQRAGIEAAKQRGVSRAAPQAWTMAGLSCFASREKGPRRSPES